MNDRNRNTLQETVTRLEAFLETLDSSAPMSVEQLTAGFSLDDASRLRALALANEFLWRRNRGEEVVEEEYALRLGGAEERETFRSVLANMGKVASLSQSEVEVGFLLAGRYELRRLLGRGGMGRVYAAFDRELEREVAIKVLERSLDLARAQVREELFRRESRTLAQLDSHGIVAIHDVVRSESHAFLVMDLVEGRNLAEVLARARAERAAGQREDSPELLRRAVGRAEDGGQHAGLHEATHERAAAHLLREAARAVEQAHAQGIVHRDLKPENIMIESGGTPVILDFGLASWSADGSSKGLRGTPRYLAPEQIQRRESGSDPRADVYQLGLILHELLTLRPAFAEVEGESLTELLERIRRGGFTAAAQLLPRLAPSLAAILGRALARDPEERYPNAGELREDLDRFLARLPPRHARVAPLHALRLRATRRLRQPLTLATLLALVTASYLFRGAGWDPISARAFLLSSERAEPRALSQGETIEVQDPSLLGVELRITQSAWVHAFSLFASDASAASRRLRPVAPETLESLRAPDYRPSPLPRPLHLQAGEHRLVCSALREPDALEGLLVIVTREPSELLQTWQERLGAEELARGSALSFAESDELLRSLSGTLRGDPVGRLAGAELRTIVEHLSPSEATDYDPWTERGWLAYEFLFPVRRGP